MKIDKVKIHNWRSIKDLEIDFRDLMIFIGQNNHGKSNVLSSLLFFFGQIGLADLDFNKGSDELFVEVTFSDLDEYDQKQFSKYLTADSKIRVRKQATKGEPFEYHGYCQIPKEFWLREENISNYTSREKIDAVPLSAHVPSSGRITKEIVKNAQEEYIKANTDQVDFSYELETTNFLGLKTVAQGIFGEVFFVPAVKSASDEFNPKGKSIFSQLLTNVINEMSSSHDDYMEVKNRVKDLAKLLNKRDEEGNINTSRPEQIQQLEQLLETELESWQTSIDIEITPPDVDEALKVGTSVWVDDGVPTDVDRKGHGLQRSLIFALIKAWAKVTQDQREKAGGSDETEGHRRASRSSYFMFEEPELYLHPQAQRELYSSLKKLSEVSSQVLITTHSSSFVDLTQYQSICVLYKKDLSEGTKHLQCIDDLFGSIDEKKKFNMTYWINPDRGELFFAKKTILLEGPTDKTVIPYLAKEIEVFRYDYTIIDCGGKDNIPIYAHLLNKFQLPYVAVYDQDHQSGKGAGAIASANASTQAVEDSIKNSFGTSVVLVNDIEEEIGITGDVNKSKPYYALEKISAEGFTISDDLKSKIQEIYS